jgi:hypothetical protein
MFHSEVEAASGPLESTLGSGLWYDPERIVLGGAYTDQVTAYRARKRWIKALETNFLLENQHDFRLQVTTDPETERFCVRCDFLTACGRYAFWRLTHNQAPDVQFMLETAHLPSLNFIQLSQEAHADYEHEPRVFSAVPVEEGGVPSLARRCAAWVHRVLIRRVLTRR